MDRLRLYALLVRAHKPIGILLLLWPTLIALWLASGGVPDWRILVIYVLGTVLMRSAGCAINDYADRDFDRHVKRTEQRPLTSGKIKSWEALMVAGVLALVSFLLILPLNALTLQLSVAAVIIAGSYPYFKRFFAIPQAYLGIAFGFGMPLWPVTRPQPPWRPGHCPVSAARPGRCAGSCCQEDRAGKYIHATAALHPNPVPATGRRRDR